MKYATVLSKNEPFFLKYYRFTINCMLCKVRTSASVAFINSPSITSLNYASALISHAKCRILHTHQQNKNNEKGPTVYASNVKKKSFLLYSSICYFRKKMWYLCTKASHVYSILTKDFAIECVLFYFLLPTQRVNRFDELCGLWKVFRVPRKSV